MRESVTLNVTLNKTFRFVLVGKCIPKRNPKCIPNS